MVQGGRFDGAAVRAVDPEGALLRALPWQRIVGCVVYIAAHVLEPGTVKTTNANRLVLGEPHHRTSPRVGARDAGARAKSRSVLRAVTDAE